MSNVLARQRGISDMEFYHTADDLRTELSALLMRDNVIPKKWRHVITYRALNILQDLFDCMHEANRIYPYTPEEVTERKRLQQKCISCLDGIYEVMQNAMRNVWWQKLHAVNKETGQPTKERLLLEKHITDIGNLLDREEMLLVGWKRSTKLLKR